MAQRPRKQIENKPSLLLSPEENQQIFRLVGSRCKVLKLKMYILLLSHCIIVSYVLDYGDSGSAAISYTTS